MAYEAYRAIVLSRDGVAREILPAVQTVSKGTSNQGHRLKDTFLRARNLAAMAMAGPPVPATFRSYDDFAVAVLNNQWELSMANGCAYYNAAVATTSGKKYIYVSTGNIHRAYWIWDAVYPVLPGPYMGTFMTEDQADQKGYLQGMHLVVPDVFQSDGGFSNFPY